MFDSQFDIRVNTVNCVGVMGAGVALAFKRRYPEMFLDYKTACEANEVKPGKLYIWHKTNAEWVINFPTKRDWREKSRYSDIAEGLKTLKTYLRGFGAIKVALPALGCGHGGLDWNVVYPMIVHELSELEAEVHVFEPASSLKIGRRATQNDTDHSLLELGDYGFFAAELVKVKGKEARRFYVRANWNPFAYRWIALLPSKELTDREIDALKSIATQLRPTSDSTAVVLLYKVRSSLQVVEIFSQQGINVVLVLPFGPLANPKLAREIDEMDLNQVAVISFAEPKQKWTNFLGVGANNFIFANSSSALLSDPSSEAINDISLKKWRYDPFVFVRYRDHSMETLEFLERNGLRPIGKRPDTGQLNLLPLLASKNELTVTGAERTDLQNPHLVSVSQLNKILDALSRFGSESQYEIFFTIKTESTELDLLVREIMEDVNLRIDMDQS